MLCGSFVTLCSSYMIVGRPRYQKVLLKKLDGNFVLEAGKKWKDIGYSLVSKVWVVTKADSGFLWGKSRDCDYPLLNCITVKNMKFRAQR